MNPQPPPPVPSPETQLEADVKKWQQLTLWLQQAKEQEMLLRQSIASRVFNAQRTAAGAFPEGTVHNVAQGSTINFKMRLETKYTREVLEESMDSAIKEAELDADEVKHLVKMVPQLSVRAYKDLDPKKRAIIDKAILTKQGSIKLEVIPLPK